jgi:hypothetical protein
MNARIASDTNNFRIFTPCTIWLGPRTVHPVNSVAHLLRSSIKFSRKTSHTVTETDTPVWPCNGKPALYRD